jgi:hypothetical protein
MSAQEMLAVSDLGARAIAVSSLLPQLHFFHRDLPHLRGCCQVTDGGTSKTAFDSRGDVLLLPTQHRWNPRLDVMRCRPVAAMTDTKDKTLLQSVGSMHDFRAWLKGHKLMALGAYAAFHVEVAVRVALVASGAHGTTTLFG